MLLFGAFCVFFAGHPHADLEACKMFRTVIPRGLGPPHQCEERRCVQPFGLAVSNEARRRRTGARAKSRAYGGVSAGYRAVERGEIWSRRAKVRALGGV